MLIKVNCLHCSKSFEAREIDIKKGNGKFCSIVCANTYIKLNRKKKEPNVFCSNCGKNFYKNNTKRKLSKSGLFFCCRKCKDVAQRAEGIKAIHPSHYGNEIGVWLYRQFALRNLENKCNRCGYSEFVKILQVHHKDKNRNNNHLDNLEILCPNCHAIEHWT